MKSVFFKRRMKLQKEFRKWAHQKGVEDCPASVIAFLSNKGLIHDFADNPTYYILRRTVGKTTMHYEYLDQTGNWNLHENSAFLFSKRDHGLETHAKVVKADIIPIKLVEVKE